MGWCNFCQVEHSSASCYHPSNTVSRRQDWKAKWIIQKARIAELEKEEREWQRGKALVVIENERIVAESKQAHSRNDELVSEHIQLKAEIERLRGALKEIAYNSHGFADATSGFKTIVARAKAALEDK